MNADGDQNQYEYDHIANHQKGLGGDKVWKEGVGDGMDLMTSANEDE